MRASQSNLLRHLTQQMLKKPVKGRRIKYGIIKTL
jgi:hypothetical protein